MPVMVTGSGVDWDGVRALNLASSVAVHGQ